MNFNIGLLQKTYSLEALLAGVTHNPLGIPLTRTGFSTVRISGSGKTGKQECRRVLNISLAGCVEMEVMLSMLKRMKSVEGNMLNDLRKSWTDERITISRSMNKLESDE